MNQPSMNGLHAPQGSMPEKEAVGRTLVDLNVANLQDVLMFRAGAIPGNQVRQVQLQGVIDTGTNYLILPTAVAQQLGLPKVGEATIRYADQRAAVRDMVELVELQLLGRKGTYRALLEPDRQTALVGAIVLEDLDFIIDPGNQRIYPRDPQRIIAEVE